MQNHWQYGKQSLLITGDGTAQHGTLRPVNRVPALIHAGKTQEILRPCGRPEAIPLRLNRQEFISALQNPVAAPLLVNRGRCSATWHIPYSHGRPAWILRRILRVIVSPKTGNTTETAPLHGRWLAIGRLPADVDVDPAAAMSVRFSSPDAAGDSRR